MAELNFTPKPDDENVIPTPYLLLTPEGAAAQASVMQWGSLKLIDEFLEKNRNTQAEAVVANKECQTCGNLPYDYNGAEFLRTTAPQMVTLIQILMTFTAGVTEVSTPHGLRLRFISAGDTLRGWAVCNPKTRQFIKGKEITPDYVTEWVEGPPMVEGKMSGTPEFTASIIFPPNILHAWYAALLAEYQTLPLQFPEAPGDPTTKEGPTKN